jgi:hypothetical protein
VISLGTVFGVSSEHEVPNEVYATVARSRSVASGVLAACSLDPEAAVSEIALVVAKGLADSAAVLSRMGADAPADLLVLLAAEHHWMEAILDILDSGSPDVVGLISRLSGSLRSV